MKINIIVLLLIRTVLCTIDNTSIGCDETFNFYYNLKSECSIVYNNTDFTNLISENTTSIAAQEKILKYLKEKQNKHKWRISYEPTDYFEENLDPIYIIAMVLFLLATFVMIFSIVIVLKSENEHEKNKPSVIFTSKRISKDCDEIIFFDN